jgi:signal transduction histidine kinase
VLRDDRPFELPGWANRLLDPAIALGMTLLLAGIAVSSSANQDGVGRQVVVPLAFALSQGVPLLWRRRRPMLVLAIVVASALLLWTAAGTRGAPPAVLIALYTVASLTDRRTSLRALVLASLVVLPYAADTTAPLRGGREPFQFVRLGFQEAVIVAAWLAGEAVRARRQYLAQLEMRAAQLEHERETEAARAVAEEQTRIARELHDVIAHNVSVMVVQAAAADEVFDDRPDEARAALRSIDATGREALAELRRLLGGIRPDETELEPQPSLARLEDLVEGVRGAGVRVVVGVSGKPRRLPPGIDLSAYRIVQEALTNVLRHSGASEVRVGVTYEPDAVVLTIADNGHATQNGEPQPGNGLLGMRERATLAGGTFEARARAGGFVVRARLPFTKVPA